VSQIVLPLAIVSTTAAVMRFVAMVSLPRLTWYPERDGTRTGYHAMRRRATTQHDNSA
jgi:hypothetical protein